jgi:RimJ/RimL family protein N-acetyltransferase
MCLKKQCHLLSDNVNEIAQKICNKLRDAKLTTYELKALCIRESKSENKCIGQASCQKSYDEFGNENSDNIRDVGWFLDFNYHGMGYGSEAARAMIDYMFKEVQIDKIETCAATDNLASWKIMEKLGFHRTNKIKKVKYTILTEEVDCYCYEITREEYLNLGSE